MMAGEGVTKDFLCDHPTTAAAEGNEGKGACRTLRGNATETKLYKVLNLQLVRGGSMLRANLERRGSGKRCFEDELPPRLVVYR